jgi:RNA recognition motif-containing protein
VHVVRNRASSVPEFGFVEFSERDEAERALRSFLDENNSERPFKVNWASFGLHHGRRAGDGASRNSVYVGDLPPNIDDDALLEPFRKFASATSAKVITDQQTGRSKGYGFVRFIESRDKQKALEEMQSLEIAGQPVRVSMATPRRPQHYQSENPHQQHRPLPPQHPHPQQVTPLHPSQAMQQYAAMQPQPQPIPAAPPASLPMSPQASSPASPLGAVASPPPSQAHANTSAIAQDFERDPSNTTIFVGGVEPSVSEQHLRELFEPYGEIEYVRVPPGKGCGFVRFLQRECAERALHGLAGIRVGNTSLRLSWGKSGSAYYKMQRRAREQQYQQYQQQPLPHQPQQAMPPHMMAPKPAMLQYFVEAQQQLAAAAPQGGGGYLPPVNQPPMYFMPMPAAPGMQPAAPVPSGAPMGAPQVPAHHLQQQFNYQNHQQQHAGQSPASVMSQPPSENGSEHTDHATPPSSSTARPLDLDAVDAPAASSSEAAPKEGVVQETAAASETGSASTSSCGTPTKHAGFFGEIPAGENGGASTARSDITHVDT